MSGERSDDEVVAEWLRIVSGGVDDLFRVKRPRHISRNELRRELARLIYDVERNRNRPEEFPK